MADKLLPKVPTSSSNTSRSLPAAASDTVLSGNQGEKTSTSCTPLFKTWISLYDGAGGKWRVLCQGLQHDGKFKVQRHYRLTKGWRDFVKDNSLQIGELAC
jgi:hypothetical protein